MSACATQLCVLSACVSACAPSTGGPTIGRPPGDPPRASVPAGMQLAYAAFRTGTTELRIDTTAGSTPVEIGEDWEAESHPAWSASGDGLVFIADEHGEPKLKVVNLSSGTVSDLVRVPPRADSPLPLPFGQLSWSAASGLVAFTSALGGSADVWVATTDGSGRVSPLISGLGPKSSPAWSPDGSRLAFTCQGVTGNDRDICTVDAAGKDLLRLDTGPGDDDTPAWSPDGQWIAYASRPDCSDPIVCLGSSILIVPSRGGQPRRITEGVEDDRYPVWAPDGRTLAFTRNDEIWLMTTDGMQQARFTNGLWPTWRP
jgi:TolB protein